MNDITITIEVNDWRDVPWDGDNPEKRQRMLQAIAEEAIWRAECLAEDKFDIAVRAKVEDDV